MRSTDLVAELAQLPPLPEGIRTLYNVERERLERRYPDINLTWEEHCRTCGGDRQFLWWTEQAGGDVTTYECPCVDQWVSHRYFLRVGIGRRWQKFSWTYVPEQLNYAVDAIAGYRASQQRYLDAGVGVFFQGPPQRGKTALASLLFKESVGAGVEGYFVTASELRELYSATWNEAEAKDWYQRFILNSGLLVIDDLGREGTNADKAVAVYRDMMDALMRHRLSEGLPTFITSTEDAEKLASKYGVAMEGLLKDQLRTVVMDGESLGDYNLQIVDEEARLGIVRPVLVG